MSPVALPHLVHHVRQRWCDEPLLDRCQPPRRWRHHQPAARPGKFPTQRRFRCFRCPTGHFVLRNGTGTLQAGVKAGTESRLLTLSLVSVGWNVTAGDSILLQEIRNPNGLFNNLGSTTSPFRHRFDHSDDAYAVLSACNSVQLRGSALPRFNDAFSQGMAPIYPGRLEVSAGAGGIRLGNDGILFASPLGHLSLVTTDGNSLTGPNEGTRIPSRFPHHVGCRASSVSVSR